jgi:S-(hydroxymethyl)glutathione dehydrogenase / alcohol dehydrogenase
MIGLMRAAVLRQCPGWLEIADLEVDQPGPREVLVRTAAAGLCHSDLHFLDGKYPAQVPVVMGHESAGASVAVIGCGGIGLSCVQGAFLAGAARIIAVDMVGTKLELARRLGATDIIDASEGDVVSRVMELTGGGVEYSFEAIGLASAAEQAFNMLRRGGLATVIGMIPRGQMVQVPGTAFLQSKRIGGSTMGSNRFRVDMPRYVELYLQGRLKLDEMVSARIKLDEINDGFKALQRAETARSVVIFSD